MRTIVLGEPPAELQALIERRRALGQDRYDEMWEGTYVMAPAPHPRHGSIQLQIARLLGGAVDQAGLVDTGPFNLGQPDDFRIPDIGYHRGLPAEALVSTAAIVV